jgi:hypothetical protein
MRPLVTTKTSSWSRVCGSGDCRLEYEDRLTAAHGAGAVAAVRAVLTAMASAGPDGLDPQLRRLYL